jgi:hypothetical protein
MAIAIPCQVECLIQQAGRLWVSLMQDHLFPLIRKMSGVFGYISKKMDENCI